VSLNNRIYFRDHKPPGYGDSTYPTVSDGVRATAPSSLHFAVPEPQPQTPTDDNLQLYTIAQTVELDEGKGDDTSTDQSPERGLIPPLPETADWRTTGQDTCDKLCSEILAGFSLSLV
ncbi:hypothetical protein BJY52DRAFT_1215391, partial [Lactarius psammicola]